jgi:hypothetical protein
MSYSGFPSVDGFRRNGYGVPCPDLRYDRNLNRSVYDLRSHTPNTRFDPLVVQTHLWKPSFDLALETVQMRMGDLRDLQLDDKKWVETTQFGVQQTILEHQKTAQLHMLEAEKNLLHQRKMLEAAKNRIVTIPTAASIRHVI